MALTSFEERVTNRLSDLERRFDAFASQDKPGSQLFTAGQVAYGNAAGALGSSANLTFDGTTLNVTGAVRAVGSGAGNVALVAESAASGSARFELRDGGSPQNKLAFILGVTTTTDNVFGLYDARLAQYRLIIDNAGNVGIGYTSATLPGYKLDVNGGNFRFRNSTSPYLVIQTDSAVNKRGAILFTQSGAANSFELGIDINNNNGRTFYIYDDTSGLRFLIEPGGNVAIGADTAPGAKLTVYDASRVYNGQLGSIMVEYSGDTNQRFYMGYDTAIGNVYGGATGAGYIQTVQIGVAWRDLIINLAGGNLGVGSSAPSEKLAVSGNINVSGFYKNAGTQVVGTRKTGYVAMGGTADRVTGLNTGTVTLAQLAQRVKALQDDLTSHGMIGA